MLELKDLDKYVDVEELTTLEELKEYRKKNGVTLKDVSKELLMQPSYYSAIESGRRKTYKGQDLMEFIEDVQDAIHKSIVQRKEDTYNFEKNYDPEEDEKINLVWQFLTPKIYNQALTKLAKGMPFYKVCVLMELDELELERKLKSDGYHHYLDTKTNVLLD